MLELHKIHFLNLYSCYWLIGSICVNQSDNLQMGNIETSGLNEAIYISGDRHLVILLTIGYNANLFVQLKLLQLTDSLKTFKIFCFKSNSPLAKNIWNGMSNFMNNVASKEFLHLKLLLCPLKLVVWNI